MQELRYIGCSCRMSEAEQQDTQAELTACQEHLTRANLKMPPAVAVQAQCHIGRRFGYEWA